jgi:putative solute:sodium symporter small subunit
LVDVFDVHDGAVRFGKTVIFSWERMGSMTVSSRDGYWRRTRRLTAWLLLAWAVVSFAPVYFARELSLEVFGWPLAFWLASQGALLGFCIIVIVYARQMAKLDAEHSEPPRS